MVRGKWVRWALLAVLVALLVGRWLAVTTADRLWAESLGVAEPHVEIARLRFLLSAAAMLFAIAWCVAHLFLVFRTIGSVNVPRRLGNLEFLETLPRRYLAIGFGVLGVFLGIVLSHQAGDWWQVRMLASATAEVNLEDPLLGKDLSYYLYQLPWQRTLHSFATVLSATMLGICVVLYAAVRAIRWASRRIRVNDLARVHLAALLTAFGLCLFWGYRLEPAELVAGVHDVPYDVVLPRVRIPAAKLLSSLALVVVGASLLWMWTTRVVLVVATWGALALVSLLGHYIVPAFAGSVRSPEERSVQFLASAQRDASKIAYGAVYRDTELSPSTAPSGLALRPFVPELSTAPVWDPLAVNIYLERAAADRPGEGLSRAYLDVYTTTEGERLPIYVAARVVDLADARSRGVELSWEDVHVGRYALARGAVAVQAYGATADGQPRFIEAIETPDLSVERVTSLRLDEHEILFAPQMNEYAVRVDPSNPEVVGIQPRGVLRRLALAWALQSPQILSSDLVASNGSILWRRDVVDRLTRLVPFATFGDAHAVVERGRVHWVANGYVASEHFPYSVELYWRDADIRYLRSSLVGVVDASSGSANVFVLPNPDPVTEAWASRLPGLLSSGTQVPSAIAQHLRYPEDLFAAQSEVLRQMQFSSAAARPPAWWQRVAGDPAGGIEQYWWFGRGVLENGAGVRIRAAFEEGEPPMLSGVIDGSVHGGELRLELVRFRKPLTIPGPAQIASQFDKTRGGVTAVTGAIKTLPLGDGVLFVQSAYTTPDEETAPPTLASVIAGWGHVVEADRTFAATLDRVQQRSPTQLSTSAEWAKAQRLFVEMDDARRRGDWSVFGRAYDELKKLLINGGDSMP